MFNPFKYPEHIKAVTYATVGEKLIDRRPLIPVPIPKRMPATDITVRNLDTGERLEARVFQVDIYPLPQSFNNILTGMKVAFVKRQLAREIN